MGVESGELYCRVGVELVVRWLEEAVWLVVAR